MARPLFQQPPIRPVDLFEDFVEQRGDLRSHRANAESLEAPGSSRQKFLLIITVVAWLICAAFGIGVAFIAWLIVSALTMYRL